MQEPYSFKSATPLRQFRILSSEIRILHENDDGTGGGFAIVESFIEVRGRKLRVEEWLQEDGTMFAAGPTLQDELADEETRDAVRCCRQAGVDIRYFMAQEVQRILDQQPELLARISKTYQ